MWPQRERLIFDALKEGGGSGRAKLFDISYHPVKVCIEQTVCHFFTTPFFAFSMAEKSLLKSTEECGIKVHIGTLIGDELRRQHRPAAWLAQEINCDRTNVYKILRKGSIDTELLCRISLALDHDFFVAFQHFCGFVKPRRNDLA